MKMSRQMKYKTKEKSSWTKRIFLWLERHRRIGQLLDTSVLFGSMFVSFLAASYISYLLPNMNYLSPLSFNLILLILSTYFLVFRFSSDKLQKWRYFSWGFIGFNGLLFPFHLLVGLNWLGRRKSTNFPPYNFYGSGLCLGSYCKLSLFLFLRAGHSAFGYTDRKEKKEA